jgi:DNA-binding IclR family transcriptional regulator
MFHLEISMSNADQGEVRAAITSVSRRASRHALASSTATQGEGDKYFSRAVAKASLILDLLERENRLWSLSEVTVAASLTKSSTYRLLYTLERLGYVESAQGRYQHARSFGSETSRYISLLRSKLTDPLRFVQQKFQETTSVAALVDNHVQVVRVFECSHVVRMTNVSGRIVAPHASSLGKAVAAFQSDDIRHRLLNSYGLLRLTPATITDEHLILSGFDRVRKTGFSSEDEESTPDGYCLGVPLLVGQRALGAISISLPKSRLPIPEIRKQMVRNLQEAAREISAHL